MVDRGLAQRHGTVGSPIQLARWLACALGAALVCGLWAPPADARVYWANLNAKTIGRANLDGTGVVDNFVTTSEGACGVAVDSSYVYWAGDAGHVGRASLATQVAENSFITTLNNLPCGVAVDATHVYWNNFVAQGKIGRANLDGTGVDQAFVTNAGMNPQHPAVDSAHVYWTNKDGTSVGRADIGGGNVTPAFITTTDTPSGVAVDGTHVYWIMFNGKIGRANLDGTGVDNNFIAMNGNCGIAVDGAHIYWGRFNGSIGRANLDGSGVTNSFITTATGVCGVAVTADDPLPPPPPASPRSTATTVSCIYSPLADASKPGSSSRCEVKVADTGAPPAIVPTGPVRLFPRTGGLTATSCSLSAGSCSVGYLLGSPFGKDTILATYAGDSAHTASSGSSDLLIPPVVAGMWHAFVGFQMVPPLFYAAPSGPAYSRRRAVGTVVTYKLRQPAVVRFTVDRAGPGRKGRRGRCDAPKRSNRKRAKCTRFVAVRGSFTVTGKLGTNTVRFRGRIGGKTLKPGSYRLVATASIGAVIGKPATKTFRVKRP